MVKRAAKFLWSVRLEALKYGAVGGSSFVLDIGSLLLFVRVFGFPPVLAVMCNQIGIIVYGFLLNKYWTFRNVAMPHAQFVRYCTLAALNYGFSVAAMYVLNSHYGIDEIVVRVGSIGLMVSWNFLLYKYWVYREI